MYNKVWVNYNYTGTAGLTPLDRKNYWTNNKQTLMDLGDGDKNYWGRLTRMPYGAQCFENYHCLSNCCIPDPSAVDGFQPYEYKESCERDEQKNKLGPERCFTNGECTGSRTCDADMFCIGESGCKTKSGRRMLSSFTNRIPRELQASYQEVFKICANDPNSCGRLPNQTAGMWVSTVLVLVFIALFILAHRQVSKLRKSDGTEYIFPNDFFIAFKDIGEWFDQYFQVFSEKIKNKLKLKRSSSQNDINDENQGLNLEDQIEPIGGFYEPKSVVVEHGQAINNEIALAEP